MKATLDKSQPSTEILKRRLLDMPSVRDWPERRRKNAVNAALYQMGYNKWYDGIPLTEIRDLLERFGFNGDCMEGIYCGADGQMNEKVEGSNTYIAMTWHKMPSGRYEIVAYLS